MHRIFYIAEVFEEILDYVTKADDDNQTRSNKDLPACARVCKAWVVPSISRTWKTLDNLMHLVKVLGPMKLLPKEHVDDESTERGGGWEFLTTPTVRDWDRFYAYSSKIVTITGRGWEDENDNPVSPHAARILSKPFHRAGGSLFPRLRFCGKKPEGRGVYESSLRVYHNRTILLSQHFLQPHLSSLSVLFIEEDDDIEVEEIKEVAGGGESNADEESHLVVKAPKRAEPAPLYPAIQQFMRAVNSQTPGLEYLGLNTAISPQDPSANLASLAPNHMPHLKTLRLWGEFVLDTNSVLCLARMPVLQKLELSCSAAPFTEYTSSLALPPAAFANLQDIQLMNRSLAFMLSSQIGQHYSQLRNLEVAFPDASELCEALNRLSQIPSPLEKISVTVSRGNVAARDLLTLRSFPRLQDLSINTAESLHSDDDTMESVVENLPDLRKIRLSTGWEYAGQDPAPTLWSIHSLSQHCKLIQSISINLLARELPHYSPTACEEDSSKVLVWLGGSVFDDINSVKSWIGLCFGSRPVDYCL